MRPAVADYLKTLDADQSQAVADPSPNRVVVAAPGSGKTRTLVAAVAVAMEDFRPDEVAVVTFTSAAAVEMEKRLASLGLPAPGYCGTVHGWLLSMLRDQKLRTAWRKGTRVLQSSCWCAWGVADEDQVNSMLTEEAAKVGSREPAKALQARLSEAMLSGTWMDARDREGLICKAVCLRLKESGLLSFDMILRSGLQLVLDLADKDPEAFPYKALFWDELQDGSAEDFELLLSAPAHIKFGVGDPDQSVYGFRGGSVAEFVKLARSPKWSLRELKKNYRSTKQVCELADKVVAHNGDQRLSRQMVSASGVGSVSPHCASLGSPAEEMAYVSDSIVRACGGDWESAAVLCRNNREAREFADWLAGVGIPVRGRVARPMPADWRTAKMLLQLAANPYSDEAAASYLTAVKGAEATAKLKRAAAKSILPLAQHALGIDLAWGDPEDVLRKHGVSTESQLLVSRAVERCRNYSELLVRLAETEREEREEGKGVTVCTAHASKGREWDCVLVTGCEEGMFPSLKPDSSVEEERRLFFVACTRARSVLRFSWCETRPQSRGPNLPPGPPQPRQRSRFLTEAGL